METKMIRTLWACLIAVGLLVGSAVAPAEASAANCHFSKKEKIAMVSWIMIIPGAVITGLACKRDLFNKKGKESAELVTEPRNQSVQPATSEERESL